MTLQSIIKRILINNYDKKRGPHKINRFYRHLIKLYKKYPKTIIKLVINVDRWGYYKDLINILSLSRNKKLNKNIYIFISNKLKDDIQKKELKSPISTIAKWLPREKSNTNKRLNFIDNLTKIMYPNIQNYNTRSMKYRKIVVSLSKELGLIETLFCEEKYDLIDPEKMTLVSIRNHITPIMKNDELKKKVIDKLVKSYNNIPIYGFVKWILNNNITNLEREALLLSWDINKEKYSKSISRNLGIDITNTDLVIDIRDTDTYDNFCMMISMIGLIDNVIINAKCPLKFNSNCNISDRFNQAIWNKTNIKTFDLKKCFDLCKSKNILVITPNKHNIYKIPNKNITYWNICDSKLEKNKVDDVVILEGSLVKKTKTKYDETITFLKTVIDESEEIQKQNILFKERVRKRKQRRIIKYAVIIVILSVIMQLLFFYT